MAKRKHQNKLTRHHIVPTSRGGRTIDNICKVPSRPHNVYHTLFGNRKPDEIIDYLVNDFWNGQNEWVNKYQEKYND